jgi:hypothetical protein
MSDAKSEDSKADDRAELPRKGEQSGSGNGMSDEEAQRALDKGDNQKIDKMLDELDVSTTATGEDQTAKPDTEGSNSSSKNLDEQGAPSARK